MTMLVNGVFTWMRWYGDEGVCEQDRMVDEYDDVAVFMALRALALQGDTSIQVESKMVQEEP